MWCKNLALNRIRCEFATSEERVAHELRLPLHLYWVYSRKSAWDLWLYGNWYPPCILFRQWRQNISLSMRIHMVLLLTEHNLSRLFVRLDICTAFENRNVLRWSRLKDLSDPMSRAALIFLSRMAEPVNVYIHALDWSLQTRLLTLGVSALFYLLECRVSFRLKYPRLYFYKRWSTTCTATPKLHCL